MSEMLEQVAALKSTEASLPPGADPIEEVVAEVVAAAPAEAEVVAAEPEVLIRIGSQTFKSQADAIAYAEKLEEEKLFSDAYQQGIRDNITANAPAPVPEEDNFDEEFYANPKQALLKMKEQAKNEALSVISLEQKREQTWREFEEAYPDIDRKDAMTVLNQNMDTIGKMTDTKKAMEVLARKTRTEYERIVERFKPRSELPANRGQSVISSTSGDPSVTPNKKEAAPLTMVEQMKKLREQKRNSPA